MRRVTLAVAGLLLAAGPAAALDLPSPAQQRAQDLALLQEVGARADRVRVSVVPGPVVNEEVVLVGLAPSGAPATVRVEQRLTLTGTGDYQVRERGPARRAEALGDEPPPVTKFGAVVWQGFSPGSRELAARLTLDPGLEAPRLPLAVSVTGALDQPGQVVLTLRNQTEQPATLPTAADAPAAQVAAALDAARAAAVAPAGPRLPAAGAGLPASVPTTGDAQVSAVVGVPLRITARVQGGALTAPAAGPGGAVEGTLPPGGSVELVVDAAGTGLDLDLTAVPALDPRTLAPPGGARSWAAWAAAGPDAPARRAALDLLVATAATGARATSYAPYLGADLPGTGTTVFRYGFARPDEVAQERQALEPRPDAIAAATVALLLLAGNGVLLWRRS